MFNFSQPNQGFDFQSLLSGLLNNWMMQNPDWGQRFVGQVFGGQPQNQKPQQSQAQLPDTRVQVQVYYT